MTFSCIIINNLNTTSAHDSDAVARPPALPVTMVYAASVITIDHFACESKAEVSGTTGQRGAHPQATSHYTHTNRCATLILSAPQTQFTRKKAYITHVSRVVTHLSTQRAWPGLTSVSGTGTGAFPAV